MTIGYHWSSEEQTATRNDPLVHNARIADSPSRPQETSFFMATLATLQCLLLLLRRAASTRRRTNPGQPTSLILKLCSIEYVTYSAGGAHAQIAGCSARQTPQVRRLRTSTVRPLLLLLTRLTTVFCSLIYSCSADRVISAARNLLTILDMAGYATLKLATSSTQRSRSLKWRQANDPHDKAA